jgi:hypothetical protein
MGLDTTLNRWLNKPPRGYGLDVTHPLVAQLKAFWLLNDGDGLHVQDYSGYGYHGRITDTTIVSWVGGLDGMALKAVASASAITGVTVPTTAPALDTGVPPWSWAGVIQPATGGDAYGTILVDDAGGAGFWFNGSTMKMDGFFNSADHFSTTALTAGTTYHYAFTVDVNGNATFYLNGKADGTFSLTASTIRINAVNQMMNDGGSETYAGLLLWQALWPGRVLTAADIEESYARMYDIILAPNHERWNTLPFTRALMAAMDRPRRDIVFKPAQIRASGLTPSDLVNR